jgi:N-acetylglucosaminyldiphosphoundecaprenol N-acetyl-beta-D-mannosaminyltransferase
MVPEPVEQTVPKVSCVGVPLAAITMDEAQRLADSAIASRVPCLFSTGNAYTLVMAQSNERLMAHYHQADAVLPDGMIPVWLTKLLPRSVPDKLAGPVFFQEFVRRAPARGHRIFLLGSSDQVLMKMVERMRAMAPGVEIVGTLSPPFAKQFTPAQNDAMLEAIKAAQPDALFVGLQAPKQELWLSQHHDQLDVPVRMGVGAAFDFTAGTKKQAAHWVSKMGMEWFVRWSDEPRRLTGRYLRSVLIFAYFVWHHGLEIVRAKRQKL